MRPDLRSAAAPRRFPAGHELFLGDDVVSERFQDAALDASLWRYFAAATETDPVDISKVEYDRSTGEPYVALVAAEGLDGVGFFGRAATFQVARACPTRSTPGIGREMAKMLRDRSQSDGRGLEVRVIADREVLSGFERVLLSSGASVSLSFSAEADLTMPEEELWTSLRKSYRSLINAGRRDLRIEVVDIKSINHDKFKVFQELHREAAGRVTRPPRAWEIMYERVKAGRAQLVLAYLDERPVAATYLMRFGRIALYGSGAYARDLGKFAVSHWPLYASMLEAKRSGVERLVLGPVFLESSPTASQKEKSIGAFKLGFATRVLAQRTYRCG